MTDREAFEKWADEKGLITDERFFEEGNNFEDPKTRFAFDIWQAACEWKEGGIRVIEGKKIVSYSIITGSASEVSRMINNTIKAGFQPYGEPLVDGETYAQCVVYCEDSKPEEGEKDEC